MTERALDVLAYIERGLDPDAPLVVDIAESLRSGLPLRTDRLIRGQIRVLDELLIQARAEENFLRAWIHLAKVGKRNRN